LKDCPASPHLRQVPRFARIPDGRSRSYAATALCDAKRRQAGSDRHCRAGTQLRCDGERSAVQFSQPLGKGQAEACAFVLAGQPAVHLTEARCRLRRSQCRYRGLRWRFQRPIRPRKAAQPLYQSPSEGRRGERQMPSIETLSRVGSPAPRMSFALRLAMKAAPEKPWVLSGLKRLQPLLGCVAALR
jgi:hypothetical protein